MLSENNENNKLEENIKSHEDKPLENNNNSLRASNINNENNIQNNSLNISQTLNNPILIQLIEFGFDPIYSKRIIQYFHPLNIEEALDYLNFNQGIIQHRFIKDRNINNITCYVCGEKKETHLGYIPENEEDKKHYNDSDINNVDVKQGYIFNNIEINNIELNVSPQKICEICSEVFIPSDENTVKQCGHSYCNSCWYDFFSAQIQENKLTSIKCLNYECQESLNDEFILHLLNNNNELIKKYKKYKLEYEILNNPNKKNCPFPNCDSYLELKDPKNKDVTCLNNHTFCFSCLQKPHGKLACDQKLDISMVEFAKNNFVKKCPNCNIITEKSSGCNHMTCTKCKYQWCWLCNGKYTYEHYLEGKCKGYQFFRPKDENEIQLAFEGKIELNMSQRQQDIINDDIIIDRRTTRHLVHHQRRHHLVHHERRSRTIRDVFNSEFIRRYSCGKTVFIFFIYLIIGHTFYSLCSMPNRYMRKNIIAILFCISYFFMGISNFFQMIYFNIIMLFPYLISHGFIRFIHYCYTFNIKSKQTKIFYGFLLLVLNIFFGGIFHMLIIFQIIIRKPYIYFIKVIFAIISFIFEIIYFPLQLLINQIIFLILLIKKRSIVIEELNSMVFVITGINFIEYEQ